MEHDHPMRKSEFTITEDFSARAFRATSEDDERDSLRVLRGEERLPGGSRFRWVMGSKKPDGVIWTDSRYVLVSEAVRNEMKGLTGWSSTPVELHGDSNGRHAGYHSLVVTGRCAGFLPGETRRLPKNGKRVAEMCQGLFFAMQEGDAPDLYLPELPISQLFASARAAEVFRRLNLPNLKLVH